MKMPLLLTFIGLTFLQSCTSRQAPAEIDSQYLSRIYNQMTDIMVHDITNPPLAARFYAYASLAGYEVVSQNDSLYPSMHGRLNGYPLIDAPTGFDKHHYQNSALMAIMETAKKIQPSGNEMNSLQEDVVK